MLRNGAFCAIVLVAMLSANPQSSRLSADEWEFYENVMAGGGVVNSGPIVPGALLRLTAGVRFNGESKRTRIGTKDHPWWNNIRFLYQKLPPHVEGERPQFERPLSMEKGWRITPAPEKPLDPEPKTGLEDNYIKKDFVVEIFPTPTPGTRFLISAVLDTRSHAQQDPQIVSLLVPQVGASLIEIAPPSAIKDAETRQGFAVDQYYTRLYTGDFEGAEAAIKTAVQNGLDPVAAQLQRVSVFSYQGKYRQALEQYEKVAQMDAEVRKKNPKLEPLVWPGMLDDFRQKIERKMREIGKAR